MKLNPSLLAFVCLTSLFSLPMIFRSPATAQCVQSHVGIQLNMGKPARQTNNVRQTSEGPCTGVTQSSTSVQTQRGGGRQHQEVDQQIRGGKGNPTGINGPTVSNSVVVDVDVQTPKGFNK